MPFSKVCLVQWILPKSFSNVRSAKSEAYMQLAITKLERRRQTMEKIEQGTKLISRDKLPEYVKGVLVQHILYAIQHDKDVDFEHVVASFRDQKGVLKEEELELNMIPENMKAILLRYVRRKLEDNKDIDVKNLLSILPIEYKESLKKHFCLASLEKLKPVVYSEHSYIIRKEEPLDLMLFITQGVVWSYAAKNDDNGSNYGFTSFKRLERGDYYGEELLNRT
ncbi:hypothetical protein FEM48_Zijuj03G0172300 [Ziziphus jujuba var. spinosa]|uniref:Cyclic nucleotide-binding domain-containing protein n=1 Tax=Ziziphus jujuba var. spinosa TaxID=714518 RepID=A0A978VRL2_ZIZJJ|nr:hypothetical protein FEM48_Zijuj03G0172300 [Ziziphus jujuba var. spinosa]